MTDPTHRQGAHLILAPTRADAETLDFFHEGNGAMRRRAWDDAVRTFRRALARCPESLEIENNLAVALCRQGNFQEAEALLRHCVAGEKARAVYRANLGMALWQMGRSAEAERELGESLKLDGSLAVAHLYRAHLRFEGGRFRLGLADVEHALALGMVEGETLRFAGVLARAALRPEEAEGYFRRAVELLPEDGDCRWQLGALLDELGRYDEAVSVLEEAIALDENRFAPRYLLADVLAGMRDRGCEYRDRAIALLQETLRRPRLRKEAGSDLPQAYFLLASLWDDEPEGYPQAIKAYEKGLRLEPDFAKAHNNLGAIFCEQGQFRKALDHIHRAVQLDPDYTNAYRNMARLYYHHRSERELQKDLERLTQESPGTVARLMKGVVVHIVDLAQREAYDDFYLRGHKLKNLLAVQGSRLQRLRRKAEGQGLEKILDRLSEANDGMYEDMVGYLRVIRPQALSVVPVKLSALLGEVVDRFAEGLPEGLRIELHASSIVPPIPGDPARLAEAIENLVSNGLEAMEGGGEGVLRLGLHWNEKRSEVFLEVQDEGEGIPTELLNDVFRTGFSTKDSGSGLGLAIVRRVVADHHGSITVTRAEGGGSCFRLRFPLRWDMRSPQATMAMRPLLDVDACTLIVDELA